MLFSADKDDAHEGVWTWNSVLIFTSRLFLFFPAYLRFLDMQMWFYLALGFFRYLVRSSRITNLHKACAKFLK